MKTPLKSLMATLVCCQEVS